MPTRTVLKAHKDRACPEVRVGGSDRWTYEVMTATVNGSARKPGATTATGVWKHGLMLGPTERSELALKAATHAYLYAGAVKHLAWQLLQPDAVEKKVPPELADLRSAARQSHALMLMLALRNVLRAAEMAERYAQRPERLNLRAAIARFKARLPDLVRARGTLEHFDRYTGIKGQAPVLYEVQFLDGDGTYAIRVGDIHIDVKVATEEARHLAANAIAVAGVGWSYPVGNEIQLDDAELSPNEP